MPVNDMVRHLDDSRWQCTDMACCTVATMQQRIAVAGASPTWRRGISVTLEGFGYVVADLGTISQWHPGDGSAVVMSVDDAGALREINRFVDEHPHIPVVAVMSDLSASSYASAVRHGVCAVVDEEDPEDLLVSVVSNVLDGRVVVPHHIVQAMAHHVPDRTELDRWLSGDELNWLRSMARGTTVAVLAEDAGYSERAMFRNLKALYRRLGVGNRTEALLWASQNGLLD